MFGFGNAPMQNSMNFQFGAEEPDPLGTFRSRFSLAPDTTLEQDAAGLKKSEPKKFKATEALMQYIQDQPKREDHKLGKWGTVASALAAGATGFNNPVAGIALGRELQERPYARAMEDYATKGSGLKMAADLESDMYGQDLDYRKMMMEYGDKNADNIRGDAELKIKQDALGFDKSKWTDQQQQWRDEFDMKKDEMKAKGWEHFIDKDGNEKLVNTISKEERNLGPSIKGSELGVSRINANANATRAGAAVTSAGAAVKNANTAAETAPVTRDNLRSQITDREIVDPRNELLMQAAAAKELLATNPEYAKYVNPEDGTLKDTITTSFWRDDDEAEIKAFTTALRTKLNELRTRKKGAKVEDGVRTIPGVPKPGGM